MLAWGENVSEFDMWWQNEYCNWLVTSDCWKQYLIQTDTQMGNNHGSYSSLHTVLTLCHGMTLQNHVKIQFEIPYICPPYSDMWLLSEAGLLCLSFHCWQHCWFFRPLLMTISQAQFWFCYFTFQRSETCHTMERHDTILTDIAWHHTLCHTTKCTATLHNRAVKCSHTYTAAAFCLLNQALLNGHITTFTAINDFMLWLHVMSEHTASDWANVVSPYIAL